MVRFFGSGILAETGRSHLIILVNMALTPNRISRSLLNHMIISRRVLDILEIMNDIVLKTGSPGDGSRAATSVAVPKTISTLTFYFVKVDTVFALVGVRVGENMLGFSYGQAYTLPFNGSDFRYVWNDYGILLVQVQFGSGWVTAPNNLASQKEHQKYLHNLHYTEVEGVDGCDLSCELDVGSHLGFFLPAWYSQFSSHLRYCNLLSQSRPEPTRLRLGLGRNSFLPDGIHCDLMVEPDQPHEWEFLLLNQPLKSFNTFVSGSDLKITGFSTESIYGSFRSIGVTDGSVIMLVFFVAGHCSGGQEAYSNPTIQVVKSIETGLFSLMVCHC